MYLITENNNTYNLINSLVTEIARGDNNGVKLNGFDSLGYYVITIDPTLKIPINNKQPFEDLFQLFTLLPNVSEISVILLRSEALNKGYISSAQIPNKKDLQYIINLGII